MVSEYKIGLGNIVELRNIHYLINEKPLYFKFDPKHWQKERLVENLSIEMLSL